MFVASHEKIQMYMKYSALLQLFTVTSPKSQIRHHPLLYIVNLFFLQRHCDTTTVRHHTLIYIYCKSIFSPATLRHYDSTTPPLTTCIYGKSIFLQRHYDSTTPPLTIYSKSMFSLATLRHYDSTTPPFTIYIVNLFFLHDTATVRHHTLIYIVILYFLQRQYDSTTPPLTIYIYIYGKSIFSPVTL